ncbi:MAG: flagellar motor switch protein FliN/FliY [bacterium]|nr:MAG: flagellar motor switch protein FliN/FliY [bacterium]KAF0149232.1 MAG: flagellar motor switch protein FliN/FliY [bacterium]KAF0168869.1 MAG: flagellar motor switch protein FliN/FliY [bacterium]TXT20069.1 MAG: flagellar motor switch protein FliN/FliY [bacterium]
MSEDAQQQDDISADDWAAALAEQESAAPAAGGGGDDWAAALAEQEQADKAAAEVQPQKAQIFQNLSPEALQPAANNLDLILDIPVQLNVELGRTKIAIRNLLQLAQGSVVELDGLAGQPMDVLVNGCLIAQGEVVVVNDKFGIRLTDIISPAERLRRINR